MKKVMTMLLTAAALAGCGSQKMSEETDVANRLTEDEKAAGILTPEVMWKMGRVGSSSVSPDGQMVVYTVTWYDMAVNKSRTELWKVPAAGGKAVRLTDGSGGEHAPSWSQDGKRIWFLTSRSGSEQLWSADTEMENSTQATDIDGGIEDYGVSPDGAMLWYTRRVKVEKRSAAELYSDTPDSEVKIYNDLMERHWNYWDDGSYIHLFVAKMGKNGKAGEGRDIMPGEPWDTPMAPYFESGQIAWNHTGIQLAYSCKKLAGKAYALSTDSDIYIYDTAAGTTRNLTEGMPGYDKYPVFSPDNTRIAFTSMPRAGNESDKDRLMIIDLTSGKMTDLTARFDYNAGNIAWADNETLYFITPVRGTCQLARARTSGNVETVTRGAHDLNAFTMGSGKLVAERTTLSAPTELFTVNLDNGIMVQLTDTNVEIHEKIRMGSVEERWVKTTDGLQMLTWMIFPPDFDPTKKYPVLLYCQGGPQSVVSQRWSFRWNFQVMAAQGYIVVAPNRRGLPSFGQEWLDQISGDYSGQNIKDYLSAIDDVAKEPWADETRMGCVGASYGGYSAFFLAGHHQKRFKAFVAHCGMFNLESMYGSTEELWFPNNDLGGPYWSSNPTARRSYANSPHRFVQHWDTPILIMTGQNDFRIPYTESLQAFTAARLMNLPSRLVVFENEGHQVFKPQNSLVWQREFFGWLHTYVKNPAGKSAENQ